MKPALAVQAIFSFVASWNNYFIPALVLDSADKKTLPILIAQLRSAESVSSTHLELDGCTPNQMFWKITIPLIRPILVYVMITSMIGGLQDVYKRQALSMRLGQLQGGLKSLCGSAGTGRQARLRGVCLRRTGSSPVYRTTTNDSRVVITTKSRMVFAILLFVLLL